MDDTDKLLGRLEELRTKHKELDKHIKKLYNTSITCLLYTSPSPRDR